MNKRFKLILEATSGETLHLGSHSSEGNDNLQDRLNQLGKGKIYSCDFYGNPDYKVNLNSAFWNINKKFDTIIAGEILEHVRNPIHFLMNCNKLLKSGGKLILTTPNATSLSYLINPTWCVGNIIDPGHISCFTSGMLDLLLQLSGFKEIKIIYLNSYSKNPITKIIVYFIPRLRGGLIAIAKKF